MDYGICNCEHDKFDGSGSYTYCTNDAANILSYDVHGRICEECAATCQFDSIRRMGSYMIFGHTVTEPKVYIVGGIDRKIIAEFRGKDRWSNARALLVHLYHA